MDRGRFLKLAAGVVLAPYLARIPSKEPLALVARATPTGGAIVITNPSYFRLGDIVRNTATGEALQVTAMNPMRVTRFG